MKYLIVIILVAMASTSCVEDEFGSVVGTWVQQSSASPELNKKPPIEHWETTTVFKSNQTGGIDKNSNWGDYSTNRFKYHVLMGTVTITFDEESDNDRYVISGINSYVVSGNKLTLTGDDGSITVFTKK